MVDHKFREFLKSRQWSDNLRDFVDFAVDPSRDPELPDLITWEELEAYLLGRQASQNAIESAKHLWGLYNG